MGCSSNRTSRATSVGDLSAAGARMPFMTTKNTRLNSKLARGHENRPCISATAVASLSACTTAPLSTTHKHGDGEPRAAYMTERHRAQSQESLAAVWPDARDEAPERVQRAPLQPRLDLFAHARVDGAHPFAARQVPDMCIRGRRRDRKAGAHQHGAHEREGARCLFGERGRS
jgi:hypothetical protein